MASSSDAPRVHPLLFWGSLVVLNGLLLAPSLLAYHSPGTSWLIARSADVPWYTALFERPEADLLRVSVDVVVLLALAGLAARTPWPKALHLLCVSAYVVLLAYVVYDAIIYTFFHRSGLFYEDVHFFVDALYLTIDTLTWERALVGLSGGVIGVGALCLIPYLFRTVCHGLRAPQHRRPALIAATLVGLLAGATLLLHGPQPRTSTTPVLAAGIVDNARSSWAEHRRMQTLGDAPVDSLYDSYEKLTLTDRPHIFLFMIESYGNVLATHDDLAASYRSLLHRTERTLADDGWHMATGQSEAPMRGGRSWLGVSSIHAGVRLDIQPLYERFLDRAGDYPHLVHTLQQQGYETITLQPATRERPGIPIVEPYGFDQMLHHDDLNYTGPSFGWGLVPDQYSLNYAHEAAVAPAEDPVFLSFLTVSSHAPWDDPPPHPDDWRTLNEVTPDDAPEPASTTAQQFFDLVAYNMRVLRTYITERMPDNSVAIILGDHQPPILRGPTAHTPVHVVSRDTALVETFKRHGFVDGLQGALDTPDDLRHAGIYSLLLHALAERASELPPPVRRKGINPSILAE